MDVGNEVIRFDGQTTRAQDYNDTGRYSARKKTGEKLTLDGRVDSAHGRFLSCYGSAHLCCSHRQQIAFAAARW